MKLVVLGAAMNIALDPVFIFVLNMGVRGAAVATVLSQMASAAGALIFLHGKRATVRLTCGSISLPAAKKVLALGFTPFAIIAIDNVMIIAMNAILQKYGGAEMGDRLVTCAVIAQSFMLVMTMPLGGISGGTQSILSYNYGAASVRPRPRGAEVYPSALHGLHGGDDGAGVCGGRAVCPPVHAG